MISTSPFGKDLGKDSMRDLGLPGALWTPRPGIAARLRPHELIAMLTHHYTRVRARSLPKVKTTLNVSNPGGRQAVVIGFGR